MTASELREQQSATGHSVCCLVSLASASRSSVSLGCLEQTPIEDKGHP